MRLPMLGGDRDLGDKPCVKEATTNATTRAQGATNALDMNSQPVDHKVPHFLTF